MAHRGNPHTLGAGAGIVLGRESELALIQRFMGETSPPAALVLEGSAGIGKTTLWAAGVAAAREQGYRVLTSRPLEADTTLALAGLVDLLGGLVDDFVGQLPGSQERALMTALRRQSVDEAVDPLALSAAVGGTLRAAADERPLLVAIDDWQWLDRPTIDLLRHSMRRLPDREVRLLVARRTSEPGTPLPVLGLGSESVERLVVVPLDMAVIDKLAAAELGHHLSRPALRRVAELSGGNPFYALELCRMIDRGSAAELDQPGRNTELQGLIGDRLADLPEPTRDALGTVAALADPSSATLAEVLGDFSALDAAFRAGVLGEDGALVRFSHPLLAAAAYAWLPPARRQEIHARLAADATDPEERARHLAAAVVVPDAQVAHALDEGAAAASRRGVPSVAAALYERAASLTPKEDRDSGARRRLDAAEHHVTAGGSGRGLEIYRELAAELGPGPQRARALRALSDIGRVPTSEATVYGRQAVLEAERDPELRARCLLTLANVVLLGEDFGRARTMVHEGLASARTSGTAETLIKALSMAGDIEAYVSPGGGFDLLREGAALEGDQFLPPAHHSPTAVLGTKLMAADAPEQARPLLERIQRRALDAGDEYGAAGIMCHLSEVEVRAGNLARARSYADRALAIQELGEVDQDVGHILYVRSLVAANEGDAEQAREFASRGLVIAEQVGDRLLPIGHRSVLGFVELSLGNPGPALAQLEPLPELLEQMGIGEPGIFPCQADLIEALIGVGRIDDAEARLEPWERLGREIERPRVLATAARARGLLAADQEDLDRAIGSFEQALGHHDRLPVPIERGRTLVALGSAYRRAGQRRKARATLEEALELFERIGARIWADRARAELGRLGGRAPSGDELTPTERRVAELVAQGRTNRDVAAALFVTVRTVEANLTRVYAKLGIRSRTELAARGLPSEDEPSR
jgi:DNA-binding CsgD family transcriptional regulator